MRRILIGVVGPGERASAADLQDAFDVGTLVARAGWCVVTGGRESGVMAAACRGARDAGGLTIAILPDSDAHAATDAADVAICTGLGEARNNVIVLSAAAIIVCGMSTGTASEVALALRAGKAVILVRPSPDTTAFFAALGPTAPRVAASAEEAVQLVRRELAAIG
jgi:hypothetical protein